VQNYQAKIVHLTESLRSLKINYLFVCKVENTQNIDVLYLHLIVIINNGNCSWSVKW
jgi:hypothetical protein